MKKRTKVHQSTMICLQEVAPIEVRYRIFKITDEGHFIEPQGGYSGYYIFNHDGYASIDFAADAIKNYRRSLKYRTTTEYVILSIIK